MKLNSDTVLVGKNIILVPYESKHVDRYHVWMQSPELQELTASEPLTLDEEYDMQRSWRQDDDKCTFIVLDRQGYATGKSEIDAMAGDVNLFLTDSDDRGVAEVEVMIAEPSCRGKGFGREAVRLILHYAIGKLAITKFVCKIGATNAPSISMFSKMGFMEVSHSEVFQEITYELPVTAELAAQLAEQCCGTSEESYAAWRAS